MASPAPTLGTVSPASLAQGTPALFPREQFEPMVTPVLGAIDHIPVLLGFPVPLGHGWGHRAGTGLHWGEMQLCCA